MQKSSAHRLDGDSLFVYLNVNPFLEKSYAKLTSRNILSNPLSASQIATDPQECVTHLSVILTSEDDGNDEERELSKREECK